MTTIRGVREEASPLATRRGLTEHRVQTWCLWSAPVFVVLLFGALLLAGWVPPPSPAQSPDQVAAMYAEHTDLKRLAFVLLFLGGGLAAPFTVAIHHRLRRIPGAGALALLQLIGGSLGV